MFKRGREKKNYTFKVSFLNWIIERLTSNVGRSSKSVYVFNRKNSHWSDIQKTKFFHWLTIALLNFHRILTVQSIDVDWTYQKEQLKVVAAANLVQ